NEQARMKPCMNFSIVEVSRKKKLTA
ncbi:MAG: hypothetical protein RLZZ220_2627, partial [Pseudomonadota bacterium]